MVCSSLRFLLFKLLSLSGRRPEGLATVDLVLTDPFCAGSPRSSQPREMTFIAAHSVSYSSRCSRTNRTALVDLQGVFAWHRAILPAKEVCMKATVVPVSEDRASA